MPCPCERDARCSNRADPPVDTPRVGVATLPVSRADQERRALVLVGGDAGLRQGEMIALEWGDVDLVAVTMVIRRSSWNGIVGSPKKRPRAEDPAHGSASSGSQSAPALEKPSRLLSRGRWPAHAVFGRLGSAVCCEACRTALIRSTRPSAYVLFASRDAGRGAEGDPGARRSLDAHDDAQAHASGAVCASRGDRAFGSWATGGQRRPGDWLKLPKPVDIVRARGGT
jgi:hypothetical protein